MHIHNWSTPIRCAHGDSLPTIPNEIYFKIFSYVAPSDDGPSERESQLILSTLTKVCRLFYVELLPRVFESMKLPFRSSSGDPQFPKSIKFCEELIKDREPLRYFASYIRKCTIDQSPCRHIYPLALLRLVNLESLSLGSVHIDAKIFKALESMTSLKKLCMKYCTVESEGIDTMRSLDLTHFVMHSMNSVPEALLAAVISPSLRILELRMEDASEALYLIRTTPINWHLEKLSVTSDIIEYSDFASVLHNTPSIRTLSVDELVGNYPYVPFPILPASSLPELKRLKCNPIFLPHLIAGRTVRHIHVIPQRGSRRCNLPLKPVEVTAMTQSAANLETLRIPFIHMMQLIEHEHFPRLQTLIVDCAVESNPTFVPIEYFISMISEFPSLVDLTLDNGVFSELDLPYQHNFIIKDIVPNAPGILRVTLADGISWRRTERWHPVVPLRGREIVLYKLMESFVHTVVDFDGLFASLLRPEELPDHLRSSLFPN